MEKRYKKIKRRQNKIKKAHAKRLRQRWLERFACSLADTAEMVGSKVKKHRSNAKTRFIARKIQAEVGFVNALEETPDYAIPPILKLRKNLFLTFASWTYLMFEEMKKLKKRGKLRSVVEIFDETYDSNNKNNHSSRKRRKKDGKLEDSSEHSDSREVLNKMYEDWDNPYEVPARAREDIIAIFEKKPYWYLGQNLDHKQCNFIVYRWINRFKVVIERETNPEAEFYREDHEHITGSFCSSLSVGDVSFGLNDGLVFEEDP